MPNSLRERREALRRAVEHDEEALLLAWEQMRRSVDARLILGGQISRHPTLWIAGGFLLGLSLAALTLPGRRTR